MYLYLYLYSTGVAPVDEHHSNTSGRPHCSQPASSLQGASSFKYNLLWNTTITSPILKYNLYTVLHRETTSISPKDKLGLKMHSFKVPANSRPMSSSRRRWDYTWLFFLSCFAKLMIIKQSWWLSNIISMNIISRTQDPRKQIFRVENPPQTCWWLSNKLMIKGFSMNIGPSIKDPGSQEPKSELKIPPAQTCRRFPPGEDLRRHRRRFHRLQFAKTCYWRLWGLEVKKTKSNQMQYPGLPVLHYRCSYK